MPDVDRDRLRAIKSFPSLVKYLRDELDWPIESDQFEELTFDYSPAELGLDPKVAAKIEEIKQLRPLNSHQPWGIFFVKFEPKRLPVVALRRVLGSLVLKQRRRTGAGQQASWRLHDLLFISAYGEGEERQITFAHFSDDPQTGGDLPTLRVLGWDDADTALHLDHVHADLHEKLSWPEDDADVDDWRDRWSSAFSLRHREVITTAQQMALRLADLARVIRKRVNAALAVETDSGPLRQLMKTFQVALIHDLSEDDFADMYAQTIAYGLLSARVSRPAGLVAQDAALLVPVTSPFLKELLETFLQVGGHKGHIDFDELGVNEVVELLRHANMEAVLEDFGNRNPQEDPVIHFYELFLREYDPEKRMKRGVFYTPRPVVSFIVRSVDEILRTEFGLPDGLADTTTWGEMQERHPDLKLPEGAKPDEPFVQILDPATGTGTFLVEVIEVIHNTMVAKWKAESCLDREIQERWNEYVPKHLLPRLFGFELLMAPYAIAHMKIGLKLYETGYRFESDVRAGVYLTNALEPGETKEQVMFGDLVAEEANAAAVVKQRTPITVVIGNPPYSRDSVNRGAFAELLVARYKKAVADERNIQPLSDDYLKFLGLAHSSISRSGFGIVGFITNHSFLRGVIHRGVRGELVRDFCHRRTVDLHGNSNIQEQAPLGIQDENVFDIRQGVCVSLLSRHPSAEAVSAATQIVQTFELWGPRARKYELLQTMTLSEMPWTSSYAAAPKHHFFPVADQRADQEFSTGWAVSEIFVESAMGFITHRDDFAIGIDYDNLLARVRELAGSEVPTEEIRERYGLADNGDWTLEQARAGLRRVASLESAMMPCLYRPFDVRWCWWGRELMDRPRPALRGLFDQPNTALLCKRQNKKSPFSYVFVADLMTESCVFESAHANNVAFPVYLHSNAGSLEDGGQRRPNLNATFTGAFDRLLDLRFVRDGKGDLMTTFGPEDVFHYIYGVLHSPTYRTRYAECLKIDFPRIPLIADRDLFRKLCALGQELVDLHLLRSKLLDGTTARFVGNGDAQVVRVTYDAKGQAVSINPTYRFTGIRPDVWEFQVGGYQVLEKWLKDRGPKRGNPGRVLTEDDQRHYRRVVMALQETIRLMAEIDEVIEQHGGFPDAFATGDTLSETAEGDGPAPEPAAPLTTEIIDDDDDVVVADVADVAHDADDDEVVDDDDVDEQPASAATAAVPIEDWSTEEVMAAFRQAARGLGTVERETLLREVAKILGYQRLGKLIKQVLKGHLKAAIRRGIIEADGPDVQIATPAMADYSLDQLLETLWSVMRKNREYDREEVVEAVAHHLGFSRVTETVGEPVRSAITSALRLGILGHDGQTIWRTD